MGALPVSPATTDDCRTICRRGWSTSFAYCPRLFFYEWVDGVFREARTRWKARRNTAGWTGNRTLCRRRKKSEEVHSRSVTLSSERLRVIAKMDLVEGERGVVTPVDYKHGRPREGSDGLELWPADRAQLRCRRSSCARMATVRGGSRVLPEDGCSVFGWCSTMRAIAWTEESDSSAPGRRRSGARYPRRSKTRRSARDVRWRGSACRTRRFARRRRSKQTGPVRAVRRDPRKRPKREVRPIVSARSETRPLYLNTQGMRVGKTGGVLQVKEKDTVVQEARIGETCQVNVFRQCPDLDAGGAERYARRKCRSVISRWADGSTGSRRG